MSYQSIAAKAFESQSNGLRRQVQSLIDALTQRAEQCEQVIRIGMVS